MIKKLLFKMVVFPAIILGGYGYVMYNQTGKIPFIDGEGFSLGGGSQNASTKSLRNAITNKDNVKTSSSKQQFHKWQDAQGQWHYGAKAPEGIKSKTVDYDPNRNTVAAIKIKPRKESSNGKLSRPNSGSSNSGANGRERITGDPSDAYNPAKIAQTISDAKNLQQTLNDRSAAQMEALNNLR